MVAKLTSILYSIGSPANPMSRLLPWELHQGLNVQPLNSSRWITPQLWSVIHKAALDQCDELDGVRNAVLGIWTGRLMHDSLCR